MSPPAVKHLLVDAANIGRAWPDVASLWRRNPGSGRDLLVRLLAPFHDALGWRVSVVVDGRLTKLTTETVGGAPGFVVVTTPAGTTADDVIEQWVAASAIPGACVVATGDRLLQQTVVAAGGEWIAADDLALHLKRAEERIRRRLANRQERNRGGTEAGP